jgi:uncharacterized protein (DUF2147 family)
MKRFGHLAVLMMMLGSSAHAGTISFMFHGHRVRVERPRHCFARSCLSVIAPGLHGTHQDNGADDSVTASDAVPAKPSAPPVIAAPPPPPKSPNLGLPSLGSPSVGSPSVELAANTAQAASPPPAETLKQASPPEKPAVTAQVAAVPQQAASEPDDTPLGDWQTEGNKGLVRIESCGSALCGYMVDAATNAKGETILINMKPKMKSESATDWTGTIVSRASGSTYYATMAIKQPNTLRVEACAVGHFFCSGNDWSRIATKPQALITSRQPTVQPPS